MYALAAYQHYAVELDMDHVIKIRTMIDPESYEDCMDIMAAFHENLLLCLTDRSWVLDIFGT